MSLAETRTYHHGDLRAALIEAGLAILEEGGLGDLTLRACAARVGVSHSAPKNHFGQLRGLLTAIVAVGFDRHERAMRAGMDEVGAQPRARLLAAGEAYVRFARDNPNLFKLMFSDEQLDKDDPAFCAAAGRSYGVLVEITDGLRLAGAERLPDNLAPQLLIWSIVHGLAHLSITGQLGPIAGQLAILPTFADVLPDLDFSR